jgi:ribonuclease R
VHRLLFTYLEHHEIPRELWKYYDDASAHSSQREKEAADAERASIKYKQVEYMSERIGKIFDGTVTGVSHNGIFVEEKESKCEGMIRLRDLGSDFYEYKDKEMSIVGRSRKEKFEIGDSVRFKVKATDLARRIIDYVRA